jgi:hypothetical protein
MNIVLSPATLKLAGWIGLQVGLAVASTAVVCWTCWRQAAATQAAQKATIRTEVESVFAAAQADEALAAMQGQAA